MPCGSAQVVIVEFAAQGVAVDAQPLRGLALVAAGLAHDDLEQRTLHELHQHFVHGVRLLAVQITEEGFEVVAHAGVDGVGRCGVLLGTHDRSG